jgi:hypothetical protein
MYDERMPKLAFDQKTMRKTRALLLPLFAAALCWQSALTQTVAPKVSLDNTELRTLKSTKIGRQYDLLVSLPEDYATSGKSYPVLYVLDGWHFPLMAFLQDNNVYSQRMPAVIIVNLSQGADAMALRARDFTPTNTLQEAGSGGAAMFLDFLEHEVIPYVDKTYRTIPTDRGLLGHSYGGLFAIYCLEERPALFQRIVAASPAVGWDGQLLVKAARTKLQHLPAPVRLDISTGDDGDFTEDAVALAKALDELKPPKLDYRFTVYQGENHNSVRLVSFPAGLYWVYRK